MDDRSLPLGQVLHGNCIDLMRALPDQSVNLVFADPPYNLQLQHALWRPNMTMVDAVDDEWDQFESFHAYDDFTRAWLTECRRVLKEDGSIWVIGSYHNIFRVGTIMQDLGFWILNDVVWVKTNPMPNFRGVRFANAHETLLWASKSKGSRYTFNHHAMKPFNEDKQMRSDWLLAICTGKERLRHEGKKAHPTQKPEALLYRVLLSSTQPGDIVLDPFFGTGTTGAVAKKLHRQWIGMEQEEKYVTLARARIDAVTPELFEENTFDVRDKKRSQPRIAFATLLEFGYLNPGQTLFFQRDPALAARIKADGSLALNGFVGTIHTVGRQILNGSPCNGWDSWFYQSEQGELLPIDELRQAYRMAMSTPLASESDTTEE